MELLMADPAKKAIETLEKNGYQGHIVGGAVRDMLCGKMPLDYDIATDATPNAIIKIFDKTIPTGLQHGTVTVVIDEVPLEITTYRLDGEYNDTRHPSSVLFSSSINDDLSRRDFTINAMAYNENGLIDLFGGREAIDKKIIKAVGDPDSRLFEDALRILRAFRFASVLEFKIDEATLQACLKNAYLLNKISRERIFAELTKTICGKFPQALQPLLDVNALNFIGLNCANISPLSVLSNAPEVRYSALCFLCNCEPESLLFELHAPKKLSTQAQQIYNILSQGNLKDKRQIKLQLSNLPTTIWQPVIEAYGVLRGADTTKQQIYAKEILDFNEPYNLKMLKINGAELMAFGVKGEKVGEILKELLNYVIENPSLNEKNMLIKLAKTMIDS